MFNGIRLSVYVSIGSNPTNWLILIIQNRLLFLHLFRNKILIKKINLKLKLKFFPQLKITHTHTLIFTITRNCIGQMQLLFLLLSTKTSTSHWNAKCALRIDNEMRYKKWCEEKKKFNYVNVESLLSIQWRWHYLTYEASEKFYGDESAKLLLCDCFSTVPTTL